MSKDTLVRCKNKPCGKVIKKSEIDDHLNEFHPRMMDIIYKSFGNKDPALRANPDNVIKGFFEEVKK
ncbi:MAG: hypothetical protein KJI69_03625 [Patescibacteria group bacterium]|nr:hypothetical protein [Patescibacteria group bacterium]